MTTLNTNYEVVESVGDGAFGVVMKCREKETGQMVAVKKMKERFKSWEECLELKEVKSLRKISKEKPENVVELKRVFRENDILYLVFELCGPSLLRVLKDHPEGLPEAFIRSTIAQLLNGLVAVHQHGFFHRDIKPENLLFSGDTLKILDFGLAREIRSRPPYTQYAGTRWYRAPEILLRHPFYNSPVDIWAVGAITAELFIMRPLFQGNTETDQIFKIVNVLGPPSPTNWPEGMKLAQKMGLRFPSVSPSGLAAAVPNASPEALDFISALLNMDPNKRPSAKKALGLPFMRGEKIPLSRLGHDSPRVPTPIVLDQEPLLERPRAAPASPAPQRRSNVKSTDSMGSFMKGLCATKPIDYSQFEPQEFDDLLDDL